MMAPLHLGKLNEAKRASTANRKRMVGNLYRRIRPGADRVKVQRAEIRFDDIAGCLRVPSGGSSRQTIVIVEGASVRSRLLSPREAARLMGLSDNYKLPTNYNDAYGLMGVGVVAPVVRYFAHHLLEPLLAVVGGAKRPGFDRHERDNYPTPWAAVLPLLPHLKPGTRLIEQCAREGWLVGHLKRAGHVCAGAFDLPSHDARTARYDVRGVDAFITNPPWQTPPNNLLHPIIVNLRARPGTY